MTEDFSCEKEEIESDRNELPVGLKFSCASLIKTKEDTVTVNDVLSTSDEADITEDARAEQSRPKILTDQNKSLSPSDQNDEARKNLGNNEKMSRWALRMWTKWATHYQPDTDDRGHLPTSTPLHEMEQAQLDYWLAKFTEEAVSENGQPYKFPTMYKLLVNLLPHTRYRYERPELNFMSKHNNSFPRFRQKLKDLRQRDRNISIFYNDIYPTRDYDGITYESQRSVRDDKAISLKRRRMDFPDRNKHLT